MLRHLGSIILALSLSFPQNVEAQSPKAVEPLRFWVSGGVGASSAGLSAIAIGTVQPEAHHLVTTRVVGSREFRFELLDRKVPQEYTWEAGVLYGQAFSWGSMIMVNVATGIGILGGVRRGEYLRTERKELSEGTKISPPVIERTDIHRREILLAVGLPLHLGVTLRPLRSWGLELSVLEI